MTKSRIPLMLGFAAAGAGGYYLYSAGGDPEAAKNKMKSMSTSSVLYKLYKQQLTICLSWCRKGASENPRRRRRREVWQGSREGGRLDHRRRCECYIDRMTAYSILTRLRLLEPVLRARKSPNSPKRARVDSTSYVVMPRASSMRAWRRLTAEWIRWIVMSRRRPPRLKALSLAGLVVRNELSRSGLMLRYHAGLRIWII